MHGSTLSPSPKTVTPIPLYTLQPTPSSSPRKVAVQSCTLTSEWQNWSMDWCRLSPNRIGHENAEEPAMTDQEIVLRAIHEVGVILGLYLEPAPRD